MAKPFVSPLLGYNNNVRHKNRTFHIQTEDSGVKRPHIITHLFMDGGRILKSIKTSYAEQLEENDVPEVVRRLMKEQHKAMFIALKDGHFDAIFESGGTAGNELAEALGAPDAVPSPPVGPASPAPLEVNLEGVQRVRRSSIPPVARPPGDASAAPPHVEPSPLSRGKYAPTRPASIFGHSRPESDRSIFGNDVPEDRSLDEVILTYLAEDLDKKK